MGMPNITAHAKLKIRIELRRFQYLLARSAFLQRLFAPLRQSQFSRGAIEKLVRWIKDNSSDDEEIDIDQPPPILTPAAQEIYERLKTRIKELEAARFANRN